MKPSNNIHITYHNGFNSSDIRELKARLNHLVPKYTIRLRAYLNHSLEKEGRKGLSASSALLVFVYQDMGISTLMFDDINYAESSGVPVYIAYKRACDGEIHIYTYCGKNISASASSLSYAHVNMGVNTTERFTMEYLDIHHHNEPCTNTVTNTAQKVSHVSIRPAVRNSKLPKRTPIPTLKGRTR
jgi:hypothetical protein